MLLKITLNTIFAILLFKQLPNSSTASGIIAELTDEYFSAALVDYAHSMVFFHSPKCTYCQDFIPEFEAAADELIRNEPPVHSAKVDCFDSGKTICKQEDIHSLPTIKIYKKGVLTDEYDGLRTSGSVVNYLKNLVGITSIELNSRQNFEIGQKDITIIAFLKKSGNLRESYFNLPPHLSRDIKFGHYTIEPEDKPMIKLIHPEYMHSKFEPSEFYYASDGRDLQEFIVKHRYGLAGLRRPKNVDDFVPPLVIVYFDIDLVLRAKMFAYWRNRVLQVAKDYEHHALRFVVSPIDEFKIEFNKFGIDVQSQEKPVVFAILEDNTKFLMEEEFSVENFRQFIEGVLDNSLEPHLRSQRIPSVDDYRDQRIKPIVAKNFNKMVMLNEKDVLVEFTAPWCNICKDVEKILEEISDKVVGDDIVMLKMDGTENEIPKGFTVTSYPTIYFIPKGTKKIILYKGGRTLEELLFFMSEHSSNELFVYDQSRELRKEEL